VSTHRRDGVRNLIGQWRRVRCEWSPKATAASTTATRVMRVAVSPRAQMSPRTR